MNGPEVSVIMGVYNGSVYLRESVESILSQEGVNFEFIIINDGSTDESAEILNEYAQKDGRVKIIHQENLGLTKALIRGCQEAYGDFIARQDSDDISLPGRLNKLLGLIKSNSKVAFVSSWAKCVGPAGELLFQINRPGDPATATQKLLHDKMGPPAHGSVMFERKAYERVGGYREEFYYGQDSDLWLRMARIGKIGYVQEYLYKWRYSADAISSAKRSIQRKFGDLGQLCHKARQEGRSEVQFLHEARRLREEVMLKNTGLPPTLVARAAGNYFIGSGLYEMRDPAASVYFLRAVRYNPLHLRAWAKLFFSLLKYRRVVGKK